jgi:hypothetical protein
MNLKWMRKKGVIVIKWNIIKIVTFIIYYHYIYRNIYI